MYSVLFHLRWKSHIMKRALSPLIITISSRERRFYSLFTWIDSYTTQMCSGNICTVFLEYFPKKCVRLIAWRCYNMYLLSSFQLVSIFWIDNFDTDSDDSNLQHTVLSLDTDSRGRGGRSFWRNHGIHRRSTLHNGGLKSDLRTHNKERLLWAMYCC